MMRRSVPVILLVLCLICLSLPAFVSAQTPQNPSATNTGSMVTNTAGSASNNPSTTPSATATTPAPSSNAGGASGNAGTPAATTTPATTSPAKAGGTSTPADANAGIIFDAATAPKPRPTTTTYADPTAPTTERRVVGDPLDPPPLPDTKATLIGGVVESVDRVRNHITLRPFGGKKMRVIFDERTRFFRNGVETTFAGVKKGDRIYVDTQLDGTTVFARNVRVRNEQEGADARGQVVSIEGDRIGLRDELSGQTVTFVTSGTTKVVKGGQPATLADVKQGSLVNVSFTPDRPDRGAAQQISLIAAPGDTFVFHGKVTHLDISRGVLAVQNQTDNRNYEITFDPGAGGNDNLGIGQDVTVNAMFDGTRYMAKNINVTNTAEARDR